jgi:di/tricarboxylate transporter
MTGMSVQGLHAEIGTEIATASGTTRGLVIGNVTLSVIVSGRETGIVNETGIVIGFPTEIAILTGAMIGKLHL